MARICMERHVELCETLRLFDLRAVALFEMGKLASLEDDWDEAESFLLEAMEEAKRVGGDRVVVP